MFALGNEFLFLRFVKDFGGRSECLGTLTELPIKLLTVWNQLACECSKRCTNSTNGLDNSSQCCIGNGAQLPVHGVVEGQKADVEQQQFLRQVCVRTDQAIISFCGPPPKATIAPIPAILQPTPLGAPDDDGLPIPLIIASTLGALILLILFCCCCRRRRWCFCAGKGYDDDSSSEEDDDDDDDSSTDGDGGMAKRNMDVEQPIDDGNPRELNHHMVDNGELMSEAPPPPPPSEPDEEAPLAALPPPPPPEDDDEDDDDFDPRETNARFGEGGEMEDLDMLGPAGSTTRLAMSEEEEEDDAGGRSRWSRSVQDAEMEDVPNDPRPTGYEQYDLDDPDGPGLALRHVEKDPPPEVPEDPYHLERYVPDGGVHIPEREPWQGGYDADGGWMPDDPREPGSPVTPYRYKYEREVVEEPSPVDTRRFRRLEGLGEGAVFEQLEDESAHTPSVGPPSDMFDWVIRETLNTLDQKGDELKASEHSSIQSSNNHNTSAAANASGGMLG